MSVDPAHDLDDVLRQVHRGDCKGFVTDFAQHKPKAPENEASPDVSSNRRDFLE